MKLLAIPAVALAVSVTAQEPLQIASPDAAINLELRPAANGPEGHPAGFAVRYRGEPLLRADLGWSVGGHDLLGRADWGPVRTRVSDSTYRVRFGKSNPIRDHFREATLEARPASGPITKIQVIFRVYDDGVAFRYLIPKQSGAEAVEVTDEPGLIYPAGNPQCWPLYQPNYTTSHEARYATARLLDLATNRLIDLPLLMEYEQGLSVAITEANLRNYAGLYLKAGGPPQVRSLRLDLSPLPQTPSIKVRSGLPLASPWRVILIGSAPGRLLESNLILNLNEPSAIGRADWVKAGKMTWYWWNGLYQEPVDFQMGLNWPSMKHYLDFCARNHIAFHAIMSEGDFPWYEQTQRGYAPGPDTNILKPRAGFDMEQAVRYARAKGVGIRLWTHWKPLSERLEAAFAQYEHWGIAGLMVDFLDRDDQEMVLFAERVLQSAARHHLTINFHGAWKPTGLQRTYPNLVNHEGVLNLEYLKWSDLCSPEHNVTVPFTRMLAGPMDYHLGGFRSAKRAEFKAKSVKPWVLGTRAHHLAMYVVYENPIPMVCDAPSAYEGQPGFDFIRQVPTTWDETRVLLGEPGRAIVVARRNGREWFLGAMTDWNSRTLEVPLTFLGPGRYQCARWADTEGSDDPNHLTQENRTITAADKLNLHLASGGGQAIHFQPCSH